jgi:D5 N terminal like/RepB DNA-primase from phage plasmid
LSLYRTKNSTAALAIDLTLADPQIARDFVKTIFGHTNLPVHFCSLGNDRDGTHPFRKLDTRDGDELSSFISRWDQAERGLFYCVATLKAGANKRNKENVEELPMLFADIDLKDVEETVEQLEVKLKQLRKPPSVMVRSGNGLHALWLLKEAVELQSDGMIDRVETALKLLADVVGGDHQVTEVARLLRLPGTHNTKHGEFREVSVSHQSELRYELDDLEEWLGEQSPIILRKERLRAVTAGQAGEEDPYLAYYKEAGIKTPIDVKARLDAMMYMGGGDAAIHATQIAVAASLVNSGHTDDEIVELLIAATKAAAGDYGKRWNWRMEERSIRRDIAKWRAKLAKEGKTPAPRQEPDRSSKSPPRADNDNGSAANTEVASSAPAGNSNVVSLATARAKPKPELKADDATHIKIGSAVIGVIQKRGDDLIFMERASWFCDAGLWSMVTDNMWLNVEIEKAVVALSYSSTLRLINETRAWIQRQPSLFRKDVLWDAHGLVPTRSGLIDPRTLEVRPMLPEDYCTWRIEAAYDPIATCPWWLQMLEDVFADRQPEERAATIGVIQEMAGAGLIDNKPRELSKALVFQGGSNFGKSGLLEVLGGLFGQEFNATPIDALEGTHGKMPFLKRRPWVLHEAFDQRKWHFSSDVKTVITGEPININVKNGPVLSQRVTAPILWGTNHPPQFKESSNAIANRLVVIECRREFMPDNHVGAAKEAFRLGLGKPSNVVLKQEMSGLLTWSLQGLQRALERGRLILTEQMTKSLDNIRRDSNLVAGFLDECVNYDMDRRVSVPDFCLAFAQWWLENKGENRVPPSNEAIGKAMAAMADPRIALGGEELRDKRRRYHCGIVLNETGLVFHQAGSENRELAGKIATTTEPKGGVNSLIPEHWLEKPIVRAARDRQMTERAPPGTVALFPGPDEV